MINEKAKIFLLVIHENIVKIMGYFPSLEEAKVVFNNPVFDEIMSSEEANQKLMELRENMNNPRLDGIWREWENEAQKRRKENREWFNNFARIAIVATIIQLVVLVFCVWYFTK